MTRILLLDGIIAFIPVVIIADLLMFPERSKKTPESLITLRSLDDRIVVWGMSCSGKTTFAQLLDSHHYYCFDALFEWHIVETLGLSAEANLRHVSNSCVAARYALDGWHLSDTTGKLLPDAMVYVIYAPYDRIIAQYRVPVRDKKEHWPMFRKWYCEIDYPSLGSRYFLNEGQFIETTEKEYLTFLKRSQQTGVPSGIQEID